MSVEANRHEASNEPMLESCVPLPRSSTRWSTCSVGASDRKELVPHWSTARCGLDTLRLHAVRIVTPVNLQRGAIVSNHFEPTTEYPPTNWESDAEFVAPGPMSRLPPSAMR
jgi:hypothetical protein